MIWIVAAEIEAARTTGMKRTSKEKNHDASRLAAARPRNPPPRYGRERRPPNRPTAMATARQGMPIMRATIQELGITKITFFRVKTNAC
jgi:hypothetical protein